MCSLPLVHDQPRPLEDLQMPRGGRPSVVKPFRDVAGGHRPTAKPERHDDLTARAVGQSVEQSVELLETLLGAGLSQDPPTRGPGTPFRPGSSPWAPRPPSPPASGAPL